MTAFIFTAAVFSGTTTEQGICNCWAAQAKAWPWLPLLWVTWNQRSILWYERLKYTIIYGFLKFICFTSNYFTSKENTGYLKKNWFIWDVQDISAKLIFHNLITWSVLVQIIWTQSDVSTWLHAVAVLQV